MLPHPLCRARRAVGTSIVWPPDLKVGPTPSLDIVSSPDLQAGTVVRS